MYNVKKCKNNEGAIENTRIRREGEDHEILAGNLNEDEGGRGGVNGEG
jgi:hypothetical protein